MCSKEASSLRGEIYFLDQSVCLVLRETADPYIEAAPRIADLKLRGRGRAREKCLTSSERAYNVVTHLSLLSGISNSVTLFIGVSGIFLPSPSRLDLYCRNLRG